MYCVSIIAPDSSLRYATLLILSVYDAGIKPSAWNPSSVSALLAYAGVNVRFYPAIVIEILLSELAKLENSSPAVTATASPSLR
jgi:hypothetical protein